MYTLKNAVLRKPGKNQRFETVDISSILMNDLKTQYKDGYITLTHPQLAGDRYVSIQTLRSSQLYSPNVSFTQWLGTIGNDFIPELPEDPILSEKTTAYANFFQTGYNVKAIHPTNNPNIPVDESSKTDLLIQKAGMDATEFHQHALVSVGGFFHLTDIAAWGVKIKDGARLREVGGSSNGIGVLSFRNVCPIQQLPITNGMLSHSPVNAPYKDEVYINFGVNAEGKGVMMVIGGYLQINDSTYDIINYNPLIVRVNTRRIPLLQRYYESRKFMPMDHLSLTTIEDSPSLVSVPEFFNDANIAATLTTMLSFAVLTDEPHLFYRKHNMNESQLPGTFETNMFPRWPIRTTYGRMPETWLRVTPGWGLNDKKYILSCSPLDNTQPVYLFDSYPWKDEPVVDDSLRLPTPYRYCHAHLFEIGAQSVNFV